MPKKIKKLEPDDFELQYNTVWSFPNRGDWATHDAKYRGNWSPYIPRNVILRYSKEGDRVLDQFSGGGTTLVETKLLKRQGIGVDINQTAINIAKEHLDFEFADGIEPEIHLGDARNLDFIENNSIDLIVTHPPYANIIQYSEGTEGDLSHCDIPDFCEQMKKVASEAFRVLKYDKFCAILMGDTRRKGHVIPLAFQVMKIFEDAGFHLKEIIIKEQHNCSATGYWKTNSVKYNFLLLAHEYLFVFKKDWKMSGMNRLQEASVPFKKIDNIKLTCPKCGSIQPIFSGIEVSDYHSAVFYGKKPHLKGYVTPSIYKTAMKKISDGWRAKEFQNNGEVAYGFMPYYCPKCHTLEMKYMFILEKEGNVYLPGYKCSECGTRLEKVLENMELNALKIRCSECGEEFQM